ncbi:hypothetical protein K438DRAFT_184320 [Mycena galopus ATCC 62051]|nr:hypothetical protein K438DRAFT_184320 [Mycena galopus ATCC 62051]
MTPTLSQSPPIRTPLRCRGVILSNMLCQTDSNLSAKSPVPPKPLSATLCVPWAFLCRPRTPPIVSTLAIQGHRTRSITLGAVARLLDPTGMIATHRRIRTTSVADLSVGASNTSVRIPNRNQKRQSTGSSPHTGSGPEASPPAFYVRDGSLAEALTRDFWAAINQPCPKHHCIIAECNTPRAPTTPSGGSATTTRSSARVTLRLIFVPSATQSAAWSQLSVRISVAPSAPLGTPSSNSGSRVMPT